MPQRGFTIRAVLFDFDGTLTEPGAHQWTEIKKKIGCPDTTGVLEFIETIRDPALRRAADAELAAFEAQAALQAVPAEGAGQLIRELRRRKLFVGILTRNSRQSIQSALTRFEDLDPADFDLLITRESPLDPKPSPDGVLRAARRWGIAPSQILVVGDFVFDIEAGQSAGAVTALIESSDRSDLHAAFPDFVISRLEEVMKIVRLGTPLTGGKLPNDLLEEFFSSHRPVDPALIIEPGVGQDTAAVRLGDGSALLLKSDPITFVTDAVAEYAVVVNANDIATSGAEPRWMLTTLLFPPGSTPSEVCRIMADLHAVCRRRGITLCGGHTEVTDAVTRPVVVGMLCGTVGRDRLIDKRNMRTGDRIVLTKGVAVEGTAILAREFEDRLIRQGVPLQTLRTAADRLADISILEEARIAAATPGVSALHDVTEGGLAPAVAEFAVAGGRRFRIRTSRIPVLPETAALCRALRIDPMGLIGSGSLLVTCRPDAAAPLTARLAEAGIEAADIGEVLEPGRGVEAVDNGGPVPWPVFEADELTRLF